MYTVFASWIYGYKEERVCYPPSDSFANQVGNYEFSAHGESTSGAGPYVTSHVLASSFSPDSKYCILALVKGFMNRTIPFSHCLPSPTCRDIPCLNHPLPCLQDVIKKGLLDYFPPLAIGYQRRLLA